MRARIAFALARIAPANNPNRAAWLAEGESAFMAVDAASLGQREHMLLSVRRCIAGISATSAAYIDDCARNVWPKVADAAASTGSSNDLLDETSAMAVAMHEADPEMMPVAQLEALRDRMTKLPTHRRRSLDHLLRLRALSERVSPGSAEVEALDLRIADLRANPTEERD